MIIMDINNIGKVHAAAMQKQAVYASDQGYIPGNKPFSTPGGSSWFQRLKSRMSDYVANELPLIGRPLGLYPRITGLKHGPDTPQYRDANRDPKAWETVKRTNDPSLLLSMGDWGAKNQARLRNIAKYDPAYELARMTGAREEDIINHHIRTVEMPRMRAVTGQRNLNANGSLSAGQEQSLYDMDAKYKLKSAPLAMTQQQRDAASKYLIARRKAQEELAAGGKHTQAFGAGADIKNPFSKEDSPELYDWLISTSRR